MPTDFTGAAGYLGTLHGFPVIVNSAMRSTEMFIINGDTVIMSPASMARLMELEDRPTPLTVAEQLDQQAFLTLLDQLLRETEEAPW